LVNLEKDISLQRPILPTNHTLRVVQANFLWTFRRRPPHQIEDVSEMSKLQTISGGHLFWWEGRTKHNFGAVWDSVGPPQKNHC